MSTTRVEAARTAGHTGRRQIGGWAVRPSAALAFVAVLFALPQGAGPQAPAGTTCPDPPAATHGQDAIASLISHGESLVNAKRYQCAVEVFRAGLARSDLNDLQRQAAEQGLGGALVGLLKYAEARPILEDALGRAEGMGRARNVAGTRVSLGLCAFGEGRRADAEHEWTAAAQGFASVGDERGEMEALALLTVIRKTLADRPLHERVLALAEKVGDPDDPASAHLQWADALLLEGLGGAAIRELEYAAVQLRPLGEAGEGALARVETSLALALRQHGTPEQSLAHYEAAIAIQRRLNDDDGLYQSLIGSAAAYAEEGRWSDASRRFASAVELARRMGLPRLINQALGAVGWAAMEQHRPADARSLLEQAAKGPLDQWAAPYVFRNLATAYRRLGRLADARSAVERALALAREYKMVDAESQALLERAQILQATRHTSAALDDAQSVVAILERVRARLSPPDFLRQGFGDIHKNAYEVVIDLLQHDGRVEEALSASELARARAFADLMAAHRTGIAAGDEAMPLLGEPAARPQTGDAGAMSVRESAVATASPPTAVQLAGLAKELKSTIVEYWVGESSSYVWVVTGNGRVRSRALGVRTASLSAQVDVTVRDPLESGPVNRDVWRVLYRQLMGPVENWLPPPGARVTIIPHGPLFRLSFAALVDGKDRYLIERYALHYAPAGSVLQLMGRGTRDEARRGPYLLVADPAPVPVLRGERPLRRLPGARAEVTRIAQVVGSDPHTVFTGSAAEEGLVRAQMPGARVIHLATHAVVGDRDALASFVALGSSPAGASDARHDGRLTAGEVYDVPLQADLVVLSACRSARGVISSDGTAGLTRAFLVAGASSIVAALWDVADATAAILMPRFYEEYARNVPKDEALRRAQLAVLGDLRRGRVTVPGPNGAIRLTDEPAFWAAFALFGAP
jgi:CHAT domain-containing protein/tetratricopeptide (TPR) repeat protein